MSGPMVRAILAGDKSQTRRVVKVQPVNLSGPNFDGLWSDTVDPVVRYFACPYGLPGDRLWVKETFYCDSAWYPEGEPDGISKVGPEQRSMTLDEKREDMLELMDYRATHSCQSYECECPCSEKLWRPSIFMPRWASRILLEVVEVRVERLQEISEADAIAEGIETWIKSRQPAFMSARGIFNDDYHRKQYRDLWNEINGEGSWAANRWVWVVTFKRVEDQFPKVVGIMGGTPMPREAV